MSTTSRAALLAGGLALAFALQSPALAETYGHADAHHDVADTVKGVRAPHYRKADVTHLRIVHGGNAVRLSVRLRSISWKHVDFRTVGFSFKTPGDSYSGDYVRHHHEVQFDLFDVTSGDTVDCNWSSGSKGRTMWVRVPRSCIGTPQWVRASVSVGAYKGTRSWGDNALSGNWRRSGDGTLSPRVHAPR
jgi:hypothetical protein